MLKVLYSLPSPITMVPLVNTPSTSQRRSFTLRNLARSVRRDALRFVSLVPAFRSFFMGSATDNGSLNFDQAGQQPRHCVQRNHVWPIAQCLIGIWVRFDEQAVSARGDCAARQHR